MRVLADKKRTFCLLQLPVFANRLRNGQNVILIKAAVQRRSPVPGGPERHALLRNRWVGLLAEIRGYKFGNVDKVACLGGFSGLGTNLHVKASIVPPRNRSSPRKGRCRAVR